MAWNFECFKEIVGVANDIVVTLAAIAGGAWALLRVKRERADESALDIDVSVRCDEAPGRERPVVFVEVKVQNVGKTKIQAKPTRDANGAVYSDAAETIRYSGSLEVRSIVDIGAENRCLDWYDGKAVAPIAGVSEINLLSEYEIPEENNAVDFWMEPGETYALGRAIVLPAGLYLAKVTFVGERAGDFWARIVEFSVPGFGQGGQEQ